VHNLSVKSYCIYVPRMLHEYHIMSRYIQSLVLFTVSRNPGKSWNILPANTGSAYIYISLMLQIDCVLF